MTGICGFGGRSFDMEFDMEAAIAVDEGRDRSNTDVVGGVKGRVIRDSSEVARALVVLLDLTDSARA